MDRGRTYLRKISDGGRLEETRELLCVHGQAIRDTYRRYSEEYGWGDPTPAFDKYPIDAEPIAGQQADFKLEAEARRRNKTAAARTTLSRNEGRSAGAAAKRLSIAEYVRRGEPVRLIHWADKRGTALADLETTTFRDWNQKRDAARALIRQT